MNAPGEEIVSAKSQFALLHERRFLPFFLTQFFGSASKSQLTCVLTEISLECKSVWSRFHSK